MLYTPSTAAPKPLQWSRTTEGSPFWSAVLPTIFLVTTQWKPMEKRFVSRCGLLMSMAPRYLYCHTSPHSAFLSIFYIFSWIRLTCFYDPYLLFFLRYALINQFSCSLSPCIAYLVLDFRPHGCPVILALWWIQENKWICNSLLKCFLIIRTETALFPTF